MVKTNLTPDERARVGLCCMCRYSRVILSDRGSRFYFCERSKSDPRFPKYPPLPVLACAGYEPTPETRRD